MAILSEVFWVLLLYELRLEENKLKLFKSITASRHRSAMIFFKQLLQFPGSHFWVIKRWKMIDSYKLCTASKLSACLKDFKNVLSSDSWLPTAYYFLIQTMTMQQESRTCLNLFPLKHEQFLLLLFLLTRIKDSTGMKEEAHDSTEGWCPLHKRGRIPQVPFAKNDSYQA